MQRGQGQRRGARGAGAGRYGRYGAGPGGECRCPVCGYTIPHQPGVPCNQMTCPKCGARLIRA